MLDQHVPPSTDIFGPLEGRERELWRGRAGVAEYAFDQAASLPRWTLPETTEVLVTDRRMVYAYAADDREPRITSGELRWLWPQHLRVQPGARSSDRGLAATQIQLVCASADAGFPALVLAGGDVFAVGDADRLANVLRQAIARFRVDNINRLGLSVSSARLLSRLLIGPEFTNHQGGEGQTVTLQGALLLNRSADAATAMPAPPRSAGLAQTPRLVIKREDILAKRAAAPAERAQAQPGPGAERAVIPVQRQETPSPTTPRPATPRPGGQRATAPDSPDSAAASRGAPRREIATKPVMPPADGTRVLGSRPGIEADAIRASLAARAEEATHQHRPDLASRASELANRVADMVCAEVEPEPPRTAGETPSADDEDRMAARRTSTARFVANAARDRAAGTRRTDREAGASTGGNRPV
jgi:hypothetical protein